MRSRREALAGKGYNHVEREDAQAAHQPGEVVQDVVAFALPRLGVLQEDAEAVEQVPQHHQGKEGVGDSDGGFPLVLEEEGPERGAWVQLSKISLGSSINHPPTKKREEKRW